MLLVLGMAGISSNLELFLVFFWGTPVVRRVTNYLICLLIIYFFLSRDVSFLENIFLYHHPQFSTFPPPATDFTDHFSPPHHHSPAPSPPFVSSFPSSSPTISVLVSSPPLFLGDLVDMSIHPPTWQIMFVLLFSFLFSSDFSEFQGFYF